MRYTLPTTREQRLALKRVYDRGPLTWGTRFVDRLNPYTCAVTPDDESQPLMSYRAFRKLARGPFHKSDPYLLVPWCGMWLGIEKDGYTHS